MRVRERLYRLSFKYRKSPHKHTHTHTHTTDTAKTTPITDLHFTIVSLSILVNPAPTNAERICFLVGGGADDIDDDNAGDIVVSFLFIFLMFDDWGLFVLFAWLCLLRYALHSFPVSCQM